MWPKSFGETVGDVEVKALVNAMHQSLTEVEAKKQGAMPRDVESAGLADMLADNLAEVKGGNVVMTLNEVKGEALVHTQIDTLPQEETKKVSHVEAKTLV